ncbi:MarR family winged helix-turn-helix transcriptional regulator [Streptomyces sp. NPDC002769]|uniref:MarR family winged helix-turn-helix transcriptional regulator n=1 Tax=Streptomyces sp. NPDC002769 TaxID=3154542 RepID=UPI00332757A7
MPQSHEAVVHTAADPEFGGKQAHFLERAGFVRRRPDPDDGRATLVETTAAGNGLRRSVEQLWAQLEAITTAGMTPARQRTLLRGLEEVEHNLAAGHGSPEHEPVRSQDDGAGGVD